MVSNTEKMSRFYGLKTQDAQQKIRLAFSFVERKYLKVSFFTSFRWLYLFSTCQCHQRVFQETILKCFAFSCGHFCDTLYMKTNKVNIL